MGLLKESLKMSSQVRSGVLLKSDTSWKPRPQGYKTVFLLNSIEHQISTAHKIKMLKNIDFTLFYALRFVFIPNHWHFNMYEHDKFHVQLS